MRVLLLFRGASGCGKSTYIKEHGLEKYALSADNIRLKIQSPVLSTDGKEIITQKNDKEVWKILFNLLEKRMEKGEFTVIDATNSKSSEISKYKQLADEYRYRIYIVDMTDVPIEECKRRNAARLPEYKRVPDRAIDKMYARFETQAIPSGVKVIRPNEFDEILYRPIDLSQYKKIHVIGDIHSSYTALHEYLGDELKEDNAYIFVGDYLDRGIEPVETLKLLLSIYEKQNVILLEGNHECFHKDTEVLTKEGWKLIKYVDINNDFVAQFDMNTQLISYAKPIKKINGYSEEMIKIEGNNTKQIVTLNHDVVYKNDKIKASELLNETLIETCIPFYGISTNNGYDISDNYLKLLVWIVADGTVIDDSKKRSNSKKRVIQFHFSRERKINDLRNLLDTMNIKYTFNMEKGKIREGRKPTCFIRIYGDEARHLYDTLLNKNKHYPNFFKNLNRRQALIVIDTLLQTDAHQASSLCTYWSCIEKQDIDTIQEMCIKNSIAFTYNLKESSSGFKKDSFIYEASIKPYSQYAKKIIPEKIKYNDEVYCLTMPLGTLITRIDGKVAFSGNCNLRNYSSNIEDYSRNFKETTLPYLNKAVIAGEIKKKDLKQLCRRFNQICYFTYGEKKVLVSHGGVSSMKENLIYVSTEQLIRGVGEYEDYLKCAKAFEENTDENTYQINGHRNVEKCAVHATDRCFNLEGGIEHGGFLRVITLDENGFETHEIKNNVFREKETVEVELPKEALTNEDIVRSLRSNKYVKEKVMGNISSFNFTREAFRESVWNEQTTRARGLFIDNRTNEIVTRGYNKWFKVNEVENTKIANLKNTLKFPVTVYVKENGFLGLISYNKDTDDLMFATKSVVDYAAQEDDMVNMFKNMYLSLASEEQKKNLLDYLRVNNKTIACECIHQQKDPHIIEYDSNRIYLLDIITNDFEGKKEPYEVLQTAANSFGMMCKEKAFTFDSWEDLYGWYIEATEEKKIINITVDMLKDL